VVSYQDGEYSLVSMDGKITSAPRFLGRCQDEFSNPSARLQRPANTQMATHMSWFAAEGAMALAHREDVGTAGESQLLWMVLYAFEHWSHSPQCAFKSRNA
jgi:hypothetical protein